MPHRGKTIDTISFASPVAPVQNAFSFKIVSPPTPPSRATAPPLPPPPAHLYPSHATTRRIFSLTMLAWDDTWIFSRIIVSQIFFFEKNSNDSPKLARGRTMCIKFEESVYICIYMYIWLLINYFFHALKILFFHF